MSFSVASSSSIFLSSTLSNSVSSKNPVLRSRIVTNAAIKTNEVGQYSLQGSSRKQNEDRLTAKVSTATDDGKPYAYLGVFDGHGGYATAEWLEEKLYGFVESEWGKNVPAIAVRKAFMAADTELLAPAGFLGMGERGVGGSKCGSTCATVLVYKADGKTMLQSANAGDARVIICKKGNADQLSMDHVPDSEFERLRIEEQNPNPKMPLVKYIGGTWRVAGLLALSRAFGDAYMKSGLLDEGYGLDMNDYGSGFGVIADPTVEEVELKSSDKGWVVVCSDGLNANMERGGGGGLENEEVAAMCEKAGNISASELAKNLTQAAQDAGSTDDITVVCVKIEDLF
eukprot:CAMPEP_0196571488 /NCGR_PEP_ID=MMETSP1081-20130531/1655_1 /TAXON_ID=36882 /ORGANISM="Pyramimonas amylifera, Strain CCMP720" /LENGTH=341 /DNA_ID=CAMNT_0041888457 /DNA_START=125 /DNA_END=1150 /DNA_ORIENTATION=-